MTTPQEEAARRWREATPWTPTPGQALNAMRFAFVSGAEWLATELRLTPEQVQRLGPLVEAARTLPPLLEKLSAAQAAFEELVLSHHQELEAARREYRRGIGRVYSAAAALDEEGGE